MKKILYLFFVSLFILGISIVGCKKEINVEPQAEDFTSLPTERSCAANDVLLKEIEADPSRGQRLEEIERFTQDFISSRTLLSTGVIQIPVVVNVLYRTTAQNISDAQIASQITVLNNDFKALNTDYNNTPSIFQSVRSGNFGIEFVLAGVVRKSTTKTSWSTNNAMKSASQGGINPTSPTTTLNF